MAIGNNFEGTEMETALPSLFFCSSNYWYPNYGAVPIFCFFNPSLHDKAMNGGNSNI